MDITESLPIEVEEFLLWMLAERGRSKNTLSAYRLDLTNYWDWLVAKKMDLATVQARDIDAYAAVQRSSGAALQVWRGGWRPCE